MLVWAATFTHLLIPEVDLILDWHDDLRTRENIALHEYLKMSNIPDQKTLVINSHGSEYYLIYSKNKLIHFGEFLYSNYKEDKETIFTVEYSDHEMSNARFGKKDFYEMVWKFSDFTCEAFSVYLLDDQTTKAIWEPNWGENIIRAEIIYTYAELEHTDTSGIVAELYDWDNGIRIVNKNSMFIPFDFTHPPADNFVGCEIDGTFFLLFNHIELPKL